MIEKRTLVTQRTPVEGVGHIQVQMEKQIVDLVTGEVYIPKRHPYHRVVLEVGVDCDAALAIVNDGLLSLGMQPVEPEEWDKVKRTAAVEWTPSCRAAWNSMKLERAQQPVLVPNEEPELGG